MTSFTQKYRGIKASQNPSGISKKRIRAVYDELGSTYDTLYGAEQREKHDSILKKLTIRKESTILDLGCGTGALSLRLARKAGYVVALDSSKKMLRRAEKLLHKNPRCEVVLGDVESLPFRANSFQIVLAITVILDPPNVKRAVKEIQRILVDNCFAVLSLVTKASRFPLTQSLLEEGFRGWRLRKIQLGSDSGFFAQRQS